MNFYYLINPWEFRNLIRQPARTGRDWYLFETPAGVSNSVFTQHYHVRRGVAKFDPGLFEPGDWSQLGYCSGPK